MVSPIFSISPIYSLNPNSQHASWIRNQTCLLLLHLISPAVLPRGHGSQYPGSGSLEGQFSPSSLPQSCEQAETVRQYEADPLILRLPDRIVLVDEDWHFIKYSHGLAF